MWPYPQKTADLVTFTEEIFDEKFVFLCSEIPENAATLQSFLLINNIE